MRTRLTSGYTVTALALTAALWLLAGSTIERVAAQTAVRLFGTLSGAAKAAAVTDGGLLRVSLEGGTSAGTGTAVAGIGGVLTVSTTQTQTGNNTDETDLWTYSLPANTLSANGYGVRITAWGTTAANGNTKTRTLYFGSTPVIARQTTADNNHSWRLQADVYRSASSAQVSTGFTLSGAAFATASVATATTAPAADTTGAIVIKVTGQNGSAVAGDVVFIGASVEFLRPGS